MFDLLSNPWFWIGVGVTGQIITSLLSSIKHFHSLSWLFMLATFLGGGYFTVVKPLTLLSACVDATKRDPSSAAAASCAPLIAKHDARKAQAQRENEDIIRQNIR